MHAPASPPPYPAGVTRKAPTRPPRTTARNPGATRYVPRNRRARRIQNAQAPHPIAEPQTRRRDPRVHQGTPPNPLARDHRPREPPAPAERHRDRRARPAHQAPRAGPLAAQSADGRPRARERADDERQSLDALRVDEPPDRPRCAGVLDQRGDPVARHVPHAEARVARPHARVARRRAAAGPAQRALAPDGVAERAVVVRVGGPVGAAQHARRVHASLAAAELVAGGREQRLRGERLGRRADVAGRSPVGSSPRVISHPHRPGAQAA